MALRYLIFIYEKKDYSTDIVLIIVFDIISGVWIYMILGKISGNENDNYSEVRYRFSKIENANI